MKAAICKEPKKPLVIEELPKPEISDEEVLIKVEYCGVCHSDIHIVDGDWASWVRYPTVPGHEVAGIVVEKGAKVKEIKEGDKVGVPWLYSSCEFCDYCVEGDENLCDKHEITGITKQGGYAEYIKVPYRFVTKIPDSLELYYAAPLFCAGITVYAGLIRSNIKPNELVVVQSLGGLGHLAVMYAKAMGAKVAVVSHTKEKEELARKLGADFFIFRDEKDPTKAILELGGADIIISTAFKSEAIQKMVGALNKRGRLMVLGAAQEDIKVSPMDLISKRIVITGSATGGRKLLRETLEFSASHNIKPMVEIFDFEKVNEALDRVRNSKVMFRAVLKIN